MTTRYAARRAGFTMVELLVVILIIAILAALSLAGFSVARTAAKKAQAANEISQAGNAIAAFKAKMNVGHIPAFRFERITSGPQAGRFQFSPFRLRRTYYDPAAPSPPADAVFTTSFEWAYLRQVFPQIDPNNTGVSVGTVGTQVGQDLDPNQCLVVFLTGGLQTNFQGFSTNRAMPFTTPTGNSIPPFLDTTGVKLDGTGHLLDPWGVPYAYFSFDPTFSGTYPHNNNAAGSPSQPGVVVAPFALYPDNGMVVDGTQVAPNGVQAFYAPGSPTQPIKFLSLKSFQIISAGPNGQFGGGGAWVPGTGDYVSNGIGGDDISSFNQGPLNQESGKQ